MRRVTLFFAALCLSTVMSAQTFETSYFLDNNPYSHRINPSFQNDGKVFAFVLGNINMNAGSNLGLSGIVYPRNGKLVFGLNKAVSKEEFLSNINQSNKMVEDLSLNILTIGFWDKAGKAYNTIEVNTREYVSSMIPYNMFAFLKNGGLSSYDLSGTTADLRSYIDIAYGYSRKIGDKIKVGGRVKVLLGLAAANASLESITVNATESLVSLSAENRMMIAQPGVAMGLDKNGNYDFNSFGFNTPGIAGFGAAVDLGVSMEPVKGLNCSLAINDLGGVAWNYNIYGHSNSTAKVANVLDIDAESLLDDVVKFKPTTPSGSFDALPFTVNAGVRYKMPFYDKLSAGILGSYHHYKLAPEVNARLGVSITPVDWFCFTANYGYGTYGSSAGAMFSIIGGGCFNLFLGAETFLGRQMADKAFPVDKFHCAVNGGIAFRIGERKKK